ncbi:MAG TPA: cation-translocating P-type ATPase, partial [Verrucomicrobiae bacterium]|nr:cation-translocating P-type ATPase [Verrucomicrobiae bacterium]
MPQSAQDIRPDGRTRLDIAGMTCSGCARQVTEALQGVAYVASAWVSLEKRQALVRWQAGASADPTALVQAVQQAGFKATLPSTAVPATLARWSLNLVLAVIFSAALAAGEWFLQLDNARWFGWLSFALATVVQFGPGLQFYRGAWNQLRVGSSNMDTLVALGSTTAFVYSVWALFSGIGTHLYFMEAAAIITLVSAGHWIEARVGAKASSALQQLLQLAPASAWRLRSDGTQEQVPVAHLQTDDSVLLKPGDRVPVDGRVIEGASTVDESMLTGESLPAEKAVAASLYAGTANLTGRVILRVTGTGDDTALGHIIEAVQRAQSSRAEIQRLGDKVSSVFVPIVVLIALGTAFWWGAWPEQARQVHHALGQYLWATHPPASAAAAAVIGAAAVLIIACPCAMGLATPAAIMAAANVASRRGILIRDGVALEKAGRVNTILFDKTGTLTTGRPDVAATCLLDATADEASVMAVAASLARPSNHPLSQAVARVASGPMSWDQWQEHSGAGVEAVRSTEPVQRWRLGSLRWLADCGVDLATGQAWVQQWLEQGATVLGLARDGQLILVIALRDTLKPEAPQVIDQLAGAGLSVHLVTGDQRATAMSLARQAGFPSDHVYAEVRPTDKAALVKRLQAEGRAVAFVGDGINDAPALEQADLGIAVTRASDIARD